MRLNGWDISLAKFVGSVLEKPFAWGSHDCVTFANNAAIAQTGKGFADEFIGRHKTARGAYFAYQRFLRKSGYGDLIEGFDDRLSRVKTSHPPRGCIIASPSRKEDDVLPWVFGVSVGRDLVFVGKDKLVYYPQSSEMIYWWPHG